MSSKGKVVKFESKSKPGRFHTVQINGKKAACSCLGFSRYRHCWHIDTVKAK